MNMQVSEGSEEAEFDFYLQFDWPPHIEESLRRMLFISMVEACEGSQNEHSHVAHLRWQIATCPDSPADVLDYLAELDDPKLLVRVAENPKTWTITLARLARHEAWVVRMAVAENAHIPFVVMKSLSIDECPDVCYAMAENHSLPAKLLRQLAEHDNPYVAARAMKTLNRRSAKEPQQLPVRYQQSQQAN